MRKKILLVDDCPLSSAIIKKVLSIEYDLVVVASGAVALPLIKNSIFDLYLFDIILPQVSGYHLCTELRNHENPKASIKPLFFLSSKCSSEEILLGFNLGANDYIKKPFNVLELKARVDVYLKGMNIRSYDENLTFKDLKINKSARRVYIQNQSSWDEVKLTSTEYKLLLFFLENQNQLLNRGQLKNSVWGADANLSARTIDTHISKLRKKLMHAACYIEAVYSEGYRCAA